MRKIRELLRLKFELGLSERKVAAALSISRSAVSECLSRATAASVSWPVPDEWGNIELEQRLYPARPQTIEIPLPDFAHVQRELSRPRRTVNGAG